MRRVVVVLVFAVIGASSVSAAEVVYVEGDLTIVREGNESPGAIGSEVLEGDLLRTGVATTAIIEIDSRTTVKMRENTELGIGSVGATTTLDLDRGGLFTRVARAVGGRFSLRASTTVAGVRGTEFFVAYGRTIEDLPDVWLCVNDGEVEVGILESTDTRTVAAGEGINILGGRRLTDPRVYDWTRELNWNMDPAAGNVLDDTDLDQAYSDLLDQDYE